jgi:hypothetical protein
MPCCEISPSALHPCAGNGLVCGLLRANEIACCDTMRFLLYTATVATWYVYIEFSSQNLYGVN